jgi:hypothetical protein
MHSPNINADFEEVTQTIANAVNSTAPDILKERKELSQINSKIANGVKARMEFPELEEEGSRLRIRKSELEDIISHTSNNGGKKRLSRFFGYASELRLTSTAQVWKKKLTGNKG